MYEFSWPKRYSIQDSPGNINSAEQDSSWLALALQSAKMCAYKWDLETNIITRAKQSVPHSGLHEHEDSWMYSDALAHIHPFDRERVIRGIEVAIRTGNDFNFEFRVNLPGETTRWLLTKGHAVYGENGSAHHVFAITQEITDRKNAELRLEKQKFELELKKSQLKIALDAANMIVLTNLGPNSKFRSPELCRLYGIEDEETLLDRDLAISRIHPEDRARVRAEIDSTYINGGSIQDEHRILLPNGEIRWALIKGVHIKSYDGGGDFVVIQDITPLKKAQEQIAQQQQQLTILSNSMPNLAWIADSSGALIWVNERFVEYSGLPASELLGWGYLRLHHPEFRETNVKKRKERLASGLPWEDTFPLLSREDKWRWFLSRAEPIRDSQNAIVYWVGTNTDITAERELIKNLEGQKTMREEFTATLTHDLRNPLNVISMAVHLALQDKTGKSEYLLKAQETIKRMDNMIGELLSANLLSAGQKIHFEMELFDIKRLIDQIIDEFKLRFGSRFNFVNAGPIFGYWNQDAMRRVFENIFMNAIKYGDPNFEITVRLHTLEDKKSITVDVHNYGPTIPPEDLETIFEMHRRAQLNAHKKKSGWGIGLTLVRGIIVSHGGAVKATSVDLEGTTFKILLPIDARVLE